jgi:hypothetical protein
MQCLEAFISIGTAFDGRLIAIPRNQLFAFAHLNQATNPPAGAAYPNPRRTDMDKATPTPSPASVDKQAALVAKLRYMGKQYAAGQVARGGSPQKHYLEEAADEIEMMAWALSMNTKTPASAQENADLRNVIQAACIDGLPGLSRAWEKYFPDHPITIKGAEVERLAAQSAPTEPIRPNPELLGLAGGRAGFDCEYAPPAVAQSAPLAQQADCTCEAKDMPFGRCCRAAAQAEPQPTIPEGWGFCSADFSLQASGVSEFGGVMLIRTGADRADWHFLTDEQREVIPLYVSGTGKTVAKAIASAAKNCTPLPTPPKD